VTRSGWFGAAILLGVSGLLLGAVQAWVAGPLPGDVALTRALQSAFGADAAWAAWLTGAAKAPLLWATLLLAAGLAWWLGRGRALLVPPLALALVHALDLGLRAILFVPRPSPEVVAVAAASASSGLPSTFALTFGALFGGLLAGLAGRSRAGLALAALALVAMLVGAAARVVPGGHWPSQVLASLALGAAVALALHGALATRGIGGRSGH
jgi:hypothetical protein